MITLEQLNQVLDEKFEQKLAPVWSMFGLIHEELKSHSESLRDLQYRMGNIETTMDTMHDFMQDLSLAEEKDAEATINHELRIRKIEKHIKLRSVSPKHLASIKAA